MTTTTTSDKWVRGPQFLRFVRPLAAVLVEVGAGNAADVTELVIERARVSPEDLASSLKSGASRVKNQIAWARFYMMKAGFIDGSQRGVWKLTEVGSATEFSNDVVHEMFEAVQSRMHGRRATAPAEASEADEDVLDEEGAVEQIADPSTRAREGSPAMTATSPTTVDALFGTLAADALLESIHNQGLQTSNKSIIDYLQVRERIALFDALLERAEETVEIPIDEVPHRLKVIRLQPVEGKAVDVLPFLEDEDAGEQTSLGMNRGTKGFASALRDHFVPRDVERPRFLLTLASGTNETQKSAQESGIDESLVTLDEMVYVLLERHGVQHGSACAQIAAQFLVMSREHGTPWLDVLERLATWAETTRDLSRAEIGQYLPLLGCFLRDTSDDPIDGSAFELPNLPRKHQVRSGDALRLRQNAAFHDFLVETFNDPYADTDQEIRQVVHENNVDPILRQDVSSLGSIDIEHVESSDITKAGKNAFQFAQTTVERALFHHVLGLEAPHAERHQRVVLATGLRPFDIVVPLERAYATGQDYIRLIGFNPKRGRPETVAEAAIEQNGHAARFTIKIDDKQPFRVLQAVISRGPRSFKGLFDEFLIVVHRSHKARVTFETGRTVSLETQAWVREGDTAYFKLVEAEIEDDPVVSITRSDFPDVGDDDTSDDVIDQEAEVSSGLVDALGLHLRLEWETVGPRIESDELFDLLEHVPYTHKGAQRALSLEAFKAQEHYLDAITDITRGAGLEWMVEVNKALGYKVKAYDEFGEEGATAIMLVEPDTLGLRRRPHEGSMRYEPAAIAPWFADRFENLVRCRQRTLEKLAEAFHARARVSVDGFRKLLDNPAEADVTARAGVPLQLINLEPLRAEIEAYTNAWLDAIAETTSQPGSFGAEHEALLHMDVLENVDASGKLERLTVLATHPWLLLALLRFQAAIAEDIRRVNSSRKYPQLELQLDEVRELAPNDAIEDWIAHNKRLRAVDGAPHHFDFLPTHEFSEHASLAYVSRVVRDKIKRYLEMHSHLQNGRRTLRLGYLNPGVGDLLLDGIRDWLRVELKRARDLALEGDAMLAAIPNLDVVLYGNSPQLGRTFDDFFRERMTSSDDREVDRALLLKLRYRKASDTELRAAEGENLSNHVHICFVNSLIDPGEYSDQDGALNEWWDGCFANGLVTTYMRRTQTAATGLTCVRGLWIAEGNDPLRRGLHAMQVLVRGARRQTIQPGQALYWRAQLPDLKEIDRLYQESDWVVHLDRELSLQMFTRASADEAPTIIEYSDQQAPTSPGYDTITVTRHAEPYREQLGGVLELASLDLRGREDAARHAANLLLDDLNVLSGSWALDFLTGNIAIKRLGNRLKGNIGAALVYRWLRRVEAPELRARFGGRVVPIYISLEDLLRATPATRLPTRDGLVQRFSNEDENNAETRKFCDDLLVLYLCPARAGEPHRLYGRIIEVKLGTAVASSPSDAIKQIHTTHQLLRDHLGGGSDRLDAPFRHRQLSLLIKTQLDQALAMDIVKQADVDQLDVSRLSADLACGNYTVDYTLGHGAAHVSGDAFLLSTAPNQDDQVAQPRVEENNGVRVLRFNRRTVEWLAFDLCDAPTFERAPRQTLPHLGAYGEGIETRLGLREAKRKPVPDDVIETPAVDAVVGELVISPDSVPEPVDEGIVDEIDDDDDNVAVDDGRDLPAMTLEEAVTVLVHEPDRDSQLLKDALDRLEQALRAHKVRLAAAPSLREADLGPRLVRAYVRLEIGEKLDSVSRVSQDIARDVGIHLAQDIHVCNLPQRRAIGLDLPIDGLNYDVLYESLREHPSFEAARRELTLGFCAGIDVTGRPKWADLATMPHMIVAGTTGSGKTVFLRSILLTMLEQHDPDELELRLSSSKPMDFSIFTKMPHVRRDMAKTPAESLALVNELTDEMDRRIVRISEAYCDNLAEYNADPDVDDKMPFLVAVIDEFAETVLAFDDKADRRAFEGGVARLAQKARAAGIHLVLCTQRPDSTVIQGTIKSNVLHRFALKLPTMTDSRVVLDTNGAETLLGKGDLLYRDASARLHRLQVPFLSGKVLKQTLKALATGKRAPRRQASHQPTSASSAPDEPDPEPSLPAPRAGEPATAADIAINRVLGSSILEPPASTTLAPPQLDDTQRQLLERTVEAYGLSATERSVMACLIPTRETRSRDEIYASVEAPAGDVDTALEHLLSRSVLAQMHSGLLWMWHLVDQAVEVLKAQQRPLSARELCELLACKRSAWATLRVYLRDRGDVSITGRARGTRYEYLEVDQAEAGDDGDDDEVVVHQPSSNESDADHLDDEDALDESDETVRQLVLEVAENHELNADETGLLTFMAVYRAVVSRAELHELADGEADVIDASLARLRELDLVVRVGRGRASGYAAVWLLVEALAMHLGQRGVAMTAGELRREMSFDKNAWPTIRSMLQDREDIEVTGERRGTRYAFVGELPEFEPDDDDDGPGDDDDSKGYDDDDIVPEATPRDDRVVRIYAYTAHWLLHADGFAHAERIDWSTSPGMRAGDIQVFAVSTTYGEVQQLADDPRCDALHSIWCAATDARPSSKWPYSAIFDVLVRLENPVPKQVLIEHGFPLGRGRWPQSPTGQLADGEHREALATALVSCNPSQRDDILDALAVSPLAVPERDVDVDDDVAREKTCPRCGRTGPVEEMFGTRRMRRQRADGEVLVTTYPQSYCRECRCT